MADPAEEALFDALEAQGNLGHVRAVLRTAVFTSVDEHERDAGPYAHNSRAIAMQKSAEGETKKKILSLLPMLNLS
jgi:hypothetical protein